MGLSLRGTTSGAIDINPPAVAGDNAITLPASNGSANQFFKNSGTAGIVTYSSMVEKSDRIGIGTDNPTEKLHLYTNSSAEAKIESTSNTGIAAITLKANGGQVNFGEPGGVDNRGQIQYSNAANTLNGAAADRMEFFTNNDISNAAITITSGNNIGIGSAVPNAKLEVRDGKIRAGTDQSPQGTTILEGRYSDPTGDVLNIFGTHYSDGATVLSYGMRPKTGAVGYLSSFDNFSGGRTALVMAGDGAQIITAPTQQTTVDSDLTGVASAVMVRNNGDVTMRGTDSQYIEMASFRTTNGNTASTGLVAQNGGLLIFTPIENTNTSVIVHSTVTNPTRITFPVAGVVHIDFHQDIRSGNATTSSHYDHMKINRNGSNYVNSLIKSTNDLWDSIHGTATVEVAANDYIELYLATGTSVIAWDDSGWSSYNFMFAPINTNR